MAKFLKFFDNNEQRGAYELSEKYVTPYVSAIKDIIRGGENLDIINQTIYCVY